MNWLPSIFRRRSLYNELAEEMREHLEERTEQFEREGMSRKLAERAARAVFILGRAAAADHRHRGQKKTQDTPIAFCTHA